MPLDQSITAAEQQAEREIELTFAPVHKLCLGLGVGAATGTLVLLLTFVHLARSPGEPYPLVLLVNYFPGYSVSATGALVGFLWGGFVGFVVGWFCAFVRNTVLAITSLVFRTRAELAENRGFLDQI